MPTPTGSGTPPTDFDADPSAALALLKGVLAELQAEHEDLKLMYQTTIEHGEAVEDELAEKNLLLERTQKRLEQELHEASAYLRSILPSPRREGFPRTDWILEPSTELGGDSFGYHEIDHDHLAVYLLDVCGHGVGAALLSATAINVLRSAALPNTDFRSPSAVLSALNLAFSMERQHNMYFTIWYGVLQKSSGELRYASGGHPPSILLRAGGTALELATPNLAPGTFPEVDFMSATGRIERGDQLILVSDGVYEVDDPSGRQWSFAEFVHWLAQPGNSEPDAVLSMARARNGNGPLPDDFSYLRLRF